ncbi:hypothetical protein K227x_06620 [Rubripirellula lacrimiformis]|uniref:Uncharacterized protein n=1 Tax=Rubripirellula lacrimiformis TaxID=1930273 RepID=A0A517N573_9BACT|nr:hypothetical protein K227x_06620 [Rubripirellula lacrimiformis]
MLGIAKPTPLLTHVGVNLRFTARATPHSPGQNARPAGHAAERQGEHAACAKSFNRVGIAPCVHVLETRGPLGTR